MLTTTSVLMIGGGAALLANLFEGAVTGLQTTEALLLLAAAGALSLARGPRH